MPNITCCHKENDTQCTEIAEGRVISGIGKSGYICKKHLLELMKNFENNSFGFNVEFIKK